MEAVDVMTIGVGIAGLVAAPDPGDRGYDVVLEAHDRIGDRASSTTFPATGQIVERGGARFDAHQHVVLREEADRYGVCIGPAANFGQRAGSLAVRRAPACQSITGKAAVSNASFSRSPSPRGASASPHR